MQGIKNIIFDLGGVIINIEPERTYESFDKHLKGVPKMSIYLHDLFHQLEIGRIDADTFIREAKKEWSLDLPDEVIYEGLNAMLGDIPPERIEAILEINQKYDTYLLSNTNPIHFDSVAQILNDTMQHTFESLFKRTYYSHLVGLRKPDPKIYELVLNENNLNPEETVFLDDLGENLKSASALGIKTIQVSKEQDLIKILGEF